MIKIRQAKDGDATRIWQLLDELDLYHPSLAENNFWVADDEGEIVGVAHLEKFEESTYLSSVGVAPVRRNEGIARKILSVIASRCDVDIYAHTAIPAFFEKLGYNFAGEPSPEIPLRDPERCRDCTPEKCRCMVLKQL